VRKYKHIFFDLDRTLWDFDSNSLETFQDIYLIYNIYGILHCDFNSFHHAYVKHNTALWDAYRKGEITKAFLSLNRFLLTLNDFGCKDNEMAANMAKDYVKISPQKKILLPHAIEILDYLKPNYQLHIITNGFVEVQYTKLKNCGLDKYFTTTNTSEEAGYQKPDAAIFAYSLEKASARVEDSLMIGDDLKVDVLGAKQVGMDQIFYNTSGISHNEDITFEIRSLLELKYILN
jgi:putative hydrolase of the HAD superfamily